MLYLIVYFIINLLLAFNDAQKIEKGIKIKHGINGLIYLGLLVPAYILSSSLTVVIGLGLLRIPVFNTALNYYRGKELTYISDSTTSILDKLINPFIKMIGYWKISISILIASVLLILWQN